MLVSCSSINEIFYYTKVFKSLSLRLFKFLDIYFMCTASNSARSNNLKKTMRSYNPPSSASQKHVLNPIT